MGTSKLPIPSTWHKQSPAGGIPSLEEADNSAGYPPGQARSI